MTIMLSEAWGCQLSRLSVEWSCPDPLRDPHRCDAPSPPVLGWAITAPTAFARGLASHLGSASTTCGQYSGTSDSPTVRGLQESTSRPADQ